MPRRDLEDLRTALIDTFYLTREETGAMKYWNEAKLRETLAMFEAIAEVEEELEAEIEDEYREPYDFPDYGDEYDEDLYGYEYEATIDYPEA